MPKKPSKKEPIAADYLEGLSGGKKRSVNSRRKGVNFENKVCKMLNARFDTTDFMRSPGSGAFATSHKLPEHLMIYGDLITPQNFAFCIECKKGYNKVFIDDLFKDSSEVWKFWRQAERDSKKSGKLPLIVWQQDNKSILAITEDVFKITEVELQAIRYKNILIHKLDDLLQNTTNNFWFTNQA